MRLPKSKPTDPWMTVLEAELNRPSSFTEHHRTVKQLQELRRLAGLSWGAQATYRWLAGLIAQKKIRLDRGTDAGRKNVGKYIFL